MRWSTPWSSTLIKLRGPMQKNCWMHDTPGVLEKTLGSAVLPQSHDCGSYDPNYGLVPNFNPAANNIIEFLDTMGWLDFVGDFVSCFTRTQQGNLLEQLQQGARVLDFRVCSVGDTLHMHHGQILCEPLESAFNQVRDFLENSPEELVVIDIGHYDVSTFPGGQRAVIEKILTKVKSTFDDCFVPFPLNSTSVVSHTPIHALTQGKSRVIVAVECPPDLIGSGASIWAQKLYNGPYADTVDTAELMQKEMLYVIQNSICSNDQLFQLQWILTPNETLILDEIKKAVTTQESLQEILEYLNEHGLKQLAHNANAKLNAFLRCYKELGLDNIRSLRLDYIEQSDAVEQCIELMGLRAR